MGGARKWSICKNPTTNLSISQLSPHQSLLGRVNSWNWFQDNIQVVCLQELKNGEMEYRYRILNGSLVEPVARMLFMVN